MLFWKSEGLQTRLGKHIVSALMFYFCPAWLQLHLPAPHARTPSQATVPYLPSHLQLPTALLYLTPGRLFSNFFGSSISLKHWKAPSEKAGSGCLPPVLAASCSVLCQALPLCRSPSPSPPCPCSPSSAQLRVFRRSIAWTVTALQHLPQFIKCQSSLNSDTGYRVLLHSFGEESSKIFYFMLLFMIMHDKGSQRYIFFPPILPHAFSSSS